uniref:hypothetical protein n=1 Tax=Dysosmobacter sp. TaxID=2591382 RepID=UPI002A8F18FD|nr:hypothetical protein [Dysosmobacter sp.]MDY3282248.1 hypothetical protein [Dysosmobacter sp.]
MDRRKTLRLIGLVMLVIAVIFVACALQNPQLGRTFHVFGIPIGVEIWRVFYGLYAAVTAGLLAASFLIRR